jgi:hypothetical protein
LGIKKLVKYSKTFGTDAPEKFATVMWVIERKAFFLSIGIF